ncbi:MAG: hypothetical protein NVS3B14_08990 [Ktedonobacteraceae bacterium]
MGEVIVTLGVIGVGDGVSVGVILGVGVRVEVEVGVILGVGVRVEVELGVGVGVIDGLLSRRTRPEWMPRFTEFMLLPYKS